MTTSAICNTTTVSEELTGSVADPIEALLQAFGSDLYAPVSFIDEGDEGEEGDEGTEGDEGNEGNN